MNFFKSFNKKYLKEVNWIRQNTCPLPEPAVCNNVHFEPIRQYVADKRIVWVGENSHGVAQNNTLKSKLISFLYSEMNFKVIAFESGLSECYSVNSLMDDLDAEEIMRQSIFSVWSTRETLPLFQLLKSTDLSLAGFDFQPSSKANPLREMLQRQEDLEKATIEKLHGLTEYSVRWYDRIGKFRVVRKRIPREILAEFESSKREKLKTITQLRRELASQPRNQVLLMLDRFLDNTETFLNCITLSSREYTNLRDQIMAQNLEWLLTVIYPHEKVIVWAHNFHIFKNFKTFTGYRPMGSLVSKQIVEDSYYIGLFMYQGTAALINGNTYPLQKPRKKSLEDYMNHQEAEVGFLDFSRMEVGPENKWISRRTIILESGSFERLIIPNKHLDAVFFIKNVTPPNYLNSPRGN
ncbi:erythromycin esterase family protein [Paenibacillus larvae]|uniref:erythromycin esterase family protein n=1 Tax=Paenibacillus larvae TaxID=1464 RepID=UPI002280DC63|nr:erythromycin esterase family protein [Paenibacillus larvae]MCY9510032.1 erythromycin esterase family protein [Paenibacillus larvae]MCY9527319.1 erythromycin esterase family protein [Paenibacillus larvae]